jgi:tetratricopeptide (TPR) repeat protein
VSSVVEFKPTHPISSERKAILPPSSPESTSFQPLAGQLVVFTGKLSSLGRKDASALVARLGGSTGDDLTARTTMLVVGDEGFGTASREKSHKLQRAEALNAQSGCRIQILSEADFCALAGVPTPDALKRQYQAMRDLLARYGSVREDHLRYLMKCGVVRPLLRTNADLFFSFADVAAIKQLNDEVARGASFRAVARALVAARHGQLAFDFRLDVEPARVLTLRRPSPPAERTAGDAARIQVRDAALAEEYFRTASKLDEGDESTQAQAADAYRQALALNPYLVPALINLANIHYSCDELVEAQALYERAIGLESDFFEGHFNLGNIYHDLGRFSEAQACYEHALRLNPLYADAHFYLAVTLEKMGQPRDARPHWRSYQKLAPNGEWVELAKEFSE